MQLYLASGRVHVDVIGNDGAPLVVGMPGLTSGGSQLAVFATTAIDAGLRFVAVDLRGRGGSEWTGPGTYGWESHARDVLEVVDALGVDRFSVVGASMGGSVGMKVAALAANRLVAVVMVDIAGRVDPGVVPVIAELLAEANGVDPAAMAEDRASVQIRDPYARWAHLTMPTLLLRATQELRPGTGHVVPAADRDRFRSEVVSGEVVEIDADHVTIVHDRRAAEAAAAFISEAALESGQFSVRAGSSGRGGK